MTEQYRVGGMTCGGCARSVTGAITRALPAAKVEIDVKSGVVSVDGVTGGGDAIRKAVEAAGFEFLG